MSVRKQEDARPTGRQPVSRRALLAGASAMAGTAALRHMGSPTGRAQLVDDPNDPTRIQGRPISGYGQRSPYATAERYPAINPTPLSSWTFTPLEQLYGILTPASLHFERHHGGVPDVDPTRYRLLIHGLVERPLVFTLEELKRFPSASRIYFIECSGNSLSEYKDMRADDRPSFEVQWRSASAYATAGQIHGLLSCSEWTGVPLATLLRAVGVRPEARWVLAEGMDAAVMTRSIPLDKAMDDVLVAYAQNGEPLRPEQGYPVRLVIPGWEGNIQVKWLRRLKVDTEPWMHREETSKYTDLMPDGTARQFTMVMEAKSVITFPSGGQQLSGPGFYEISGLAWSGRAPIVAVEVSVDGGRGWERAELQEPVLPLALVRFRFPWRWDGSEARLQSRAIDATGYVQPTRGQLIAVRGTNSFYHYNGIQTWRVAADGGVTSVHA